MQTPKHSTARDSIQIRLPNDTYILGAVGTSLETLLQFAIDSDLLALDAPLIATVAGGKLRELTYTPTSDLDITPITLAHSDGGRIYRRSLVLLMVVALDTLWDGIEVNVNYAVRDGGFYCEIVNHAPLSEDDLKKLDAKMRELVVADLPITKRTASIDEAIAVFEARGATDKLRLLDGSGRNSLTLYTLNGYDDYYFGYMVPSTRYLQTFKLIHYGDAFVLQYPRKANPHELRPLRLYEKLSAVFAQADDWLNKLHVEDVGRLNHLVKGQDLRELILIAEALHEQNVARIASEIAERNQEGVRIVLIAGPSSSGKTTFSKRLAIQLLALGIRPFTIEMDNYFVERTLTPLDENGEYDFESLDALNRTLLNTHLLTLMRREQVQLPKFNFHTGIPQPGRIAQLADDQIVILEGIHGMNPALLAQVPDESIYRIYVSVLSQLNIDNHNRVPTTDVRLLRRIVRDATHRGYSAADTISRWTSVRRGEKRNIFPYQENADVMFNSALAYELAALRPVVEPLLLQVMPHSQPHLEANRLLSFLRWVAPMTREQVAMIPDTSLLREFVGGSILADYHPSGQSG
ncbi:MAG: nucleoside kinase [Chloroflexota bacterium]